MRWKRKVTSMVTPKDEKDVQGVVNNRFFRRKEHEIVLFFSAETGENLIPQNVVEG